MIMLILLLLFIFQPSYLFLDNETFFFFQTGYYGNLIYCHHSNQIHVLEVQITQNNTGGKANTVRERKVAVAVAFHVYLVFLIYSLPVSYYSIIYRSTGPNTKLGEFGLNDNMLILLLLFIFESSYLFLDNETFSNRLISKFTLTTCHHGNQVDLLEVQLAQNIMTDLAKAERERKVAVAGTLLYYVYLMFLICYLPDTGLSIII